MPGEPILFSVNVDNSSQKSIDSLQLDLIQKLVFKASQFKESTMYESHRTTNKLAGILYPKQIGPKEKVTWEDRSLIVPVSVGLSSDGSCQLIEVTLCTSIALWFHFWKDGNANYDWNRSNSDKYK